MEADVFDVEGVAAYWLAEADDALHVTQYLIEGPTTPTHIPSAIMLSRRC
jgi:hypothetical protein